MWKMIQTEWWKLRRCQILLVGIVALALCPVVQYGSQLIVNPEIRDPNYDMLHLFSSVVWGNTQVFLPISLVMIGGWLIDRENTHDTMKNLLTVPVSRFFMVSWVFSRSISHPPIITREMGRNTWVLPHTTLENRWSIS